MHRNQLYFVRIVARLFSFVLIFSVWCFSIKMLRACDWLISIQSTLNVKNVVAEQYNWRLAVHYHICILNCSRHCNDFPPNKSLYYNGRNITRRWIILLIKNSICDVFKLEKMMKYECEMLFIFCMRYFMVLHTCYVNQRVRTYLFLKPNLINHRLIFCRDVYRKTLRH